MVELIKRKTSEISNLFPILIISFIGNFGVTMVLPFLVYLVKDLNGTVEIYGILLGLYPAAQMIGGVILGTLADKYGRVPVLFISNLGTAVAWLIFFIGLFVEPIELFRIEMAPFPTQIISLPILMIAFARILDGLTGGNVAVASSYLADLSNDKNRTNNFNLMTIALNAGFVAGPALSGIVLDTVWGEKTPVFIAFLISAIATVLIPVLLKPVKHKEEEVEHETLDTSERSNNSKLYQYMLKHRVFWILGLFFVIMIVFNLYITIVPAYAAEILNWKAAEVGRLFGQAIFAALLTMIFLVPLLNKKYDDYMITILGLIIMAPGLAILPYIIIFWDAVLPGLITSVSNSGFAYSGILINVLHSLPGISITLDACIIGVGDALFWPGISSLIALKGSRKYQGVIQGYATSLGAISSFIGLVGGGLLFNSFKNSLFVSGGVIFAISALICIWLRHKELKDKVKLHHTQSTIPLS